MTEPTFLIQFIIRFINIAEFIDYLACSFILKQNKKTENIKKLSKIWKSLCQIKDMIYDKEIKPERLINNDKTD